MQFANDQPAQAACVQTSVATLARLTKFLLVAPAIKLLCCQPYVKRGSTNLHLDSLWRVDFDKVGPIIHLPRASGSFIRPWFETLATEALVRPYTSQREMIEAAEWKVEIPKEPHSQMLCDHSSMLFCCPLPHVQLIALRSSYDGASDADNMTVYRSH
ncbi:hypothetical protein MKX08_000113 [Trichoderma sp. CBMAI-0020]|nr:hypothetical protein MKX08_000113 [Trichoderma sp. CBMAI-0020]